MQRRDDVVVLFAGLVVAKDAPIERVASVSPSSPPPPEDPRRRREDDLLEKVQRDAGVAVREHRESPQRVRLGVDTRGAEAPFLVRDGPREDDDDVVRRQGLEDVDLERESSAALTSNDGFSVVAPTRTIVPASTCGRNASC